MRCITFYLGDVAHSPVIIERDCAILAPTVLARLHLTNLVMPLQRL
jgi:hypothetical protein